MLTEGNSQAGLYVGGSAGSAASIAALTQGDFYIDAVNGNDANDGATAGTALRTWAEYYDRVGTGIVTVAQTVHLLTDIAEDFHLRGHYELGLTVIGEATTVLYAGATSSAVAWNTAATPIVPGTLVDLTLPATWSDSGPAGSSLVGKRVQMTSGANVGLWSFVLADLGGGAKSARIAQLISAGFATGVPAVGETFDVQELTQIQQIVLEGPLGEGGVTFVDIEAVSDFPPLVGETGPIGITGCILRQTNTHTQQLTDAQGTILGTLIASRLTGRDLSNFNFYGCSFRDCRMNFQGCNLGFGFINAHQSVAAGVQPIASNFLTLSPGTRAQMIFGSFGGIDVASANKQIVRIEPMAVLEVGSGGRVWSHNQTNGYGVLVDSYGLAAWPPGTTAPAAYAFAVAGAGVEFRLGGANVTAAVLAGPGQINAANNAGAVPLTN